jgi:hypothetical protein
MRTSEAEEHTWRRPAEAARQATAAPARPPEAVQGSAAGRLLQAQRELAESRERTNRLMSECARLLETVRETKHAYDAVP